MWREGDRKRRRRRRRALRWYRVARKEGVGLARRDDGMCAKARTRGGGYEWVTWRQLRERDDARRRKEACRTMRIGGRGGRDECREGGRGNAGGHAQRGMGPVTANGRDRAAGTPYWSTRERSNAGNVEGAGERQGEGGRRRNIQRKGGTTRKYWGKKFDSTKGYPGEGPEEKHTRLVTVNVAGAHIHASGAAEGVAVEEAGNRLIYEWTDKAWELVNLFKGQRARLMVLADTHTETAEAEEMRGMLEEEGISMVYTPAVRTGGGTTAVAGVMIWWDARVLGKVGKEETVIEGRVLRMVTEEVGTQKRGVVYGAYMPVRGRGGDGGEAEDAWEVMVNRVEIEDEARVAIGGDLNAETRGAREERGNERETPSDTKLDEMMEGGTWVAMAEGSTHHSGSQIDNWIVSAEMATEMGEVRVTPGVCGKDHGVLMVDCVREAEGEGERRPISEVAHLFKPESRDDAEKDKIRRYGERMEEKYAEGGGATMGETGGEEIPLSEGGWARELNVFQDACMQAAEEVKQEEAEKQGKKRRQKGRGREYKEEMRDRVGKWNRIARQAQRWNGKIDRRKGGWGGTSFAKEAQLAQDAEVKRALAEGGNVKAAVISACDRELKEATRRFENADAYRGAKMLEAMEEAVVDTTGNMLVKVFEILRRAVGGGQRADAGMTAIKSVEAASHRKWVQDTRGEGEGTEVKNTKLRKALARGDSVEDAEWAGMGVRGLKLEHYVRANGQRWRPRDARVYSSGEDVKEEVGKEARRINAGKQTDVGTLRTMLRWVAADRTPKVVDVAEGLCGWEECDAAMRKGFKRGKGIGSDGFDGYLARILPERMRRRYWRILQGIVRTGEYPTEWNEWIAVLAVKPGEDPKVLERRRDLWLQCHSMKCVFRMILPVYESVADACVGTWQAGWTKGRCAPEQVLAARLIGEQRMRERRMCCRGWVDLGCYFMSVVHAVQWEVERWGGVPMAVTEVVKALREGVERAEKGEGEGALKRLVGRYETAYGLTDPVEIMKGLGQGDLASPARSKLLLTVIASVVDRACEGARVAGTEKRVGILLFADDGMLLADDVQTLQRAFEAVWMVTKVAGLRMQVKDKKKTAWAATYWGADGVEKDVEGWEMRMPDGMVLPQLKGSETYKYLGSEMAAGWGGGEAQKVVRAKVVRKCKQAVGMIGRVPLMTEEQMSKAMALALAGIIGYYGRASVITWEDAVQIETARVEVLRAKGITTGTPRQTVYGDRGDAGGLEHEHAYAYAAAALCDQVERALEAGEGSAAKAVVEAELANTCARLGCRDEHPLEWRVAHLMEGPGRLRDEVTMEAYLRTRERMRMRGRLTRGAYMAEGPLRVDAWEMTEEERERVGPKLWEDTRRGCWRGAGKCAFARGLAAAGVATWGDVSNARGEWCTWGEIRVRWGIQRGEARVKKEYAALIEELKKEQREEWVERWREQRGRGGEEREAGEEGEQWAWEDKVWEVEEVRAARRAPECVGGWEYRVKWRGGYEETWEPAHNMRKTSEMLELMRDARERKLVHTRFEEWMEAEEKRGGRAMWKVRRARARAASTAEEAEEREWEEAWEMFEAYVRHAREWDEGGRNVGGVPRQARGKTWETGDECTCYAGERAARSAEEIEATGGKRERHVPSLVSEAVGEKVQEGDMEQRVAEDLAAEAAAREAGEEECETRLPPTFPRRVMDYGGKGVFVEYGVGVGMGVGEDGRLTEVMGAENATRKTVDWKQGYEYIRHTEVSRDPVARLFGRCAELEKETGGVKTAAGRRVRMDRAGVKVLTGRGNKSVSESGRAMRVAMALHAAVGFTHAYATDGSKAEGRGGHTAYGIWGGACLEAWGAEKEWGEQMLRCEGDAEAQAVGQGMHGGRLPAAWEVGDAELYAVYRALMTAWKDAVQKGGWEEAAKTRVLILSDCQGMIKEVEKMWREKEVRHEEKGDRRAMLEAVCRVRAKMGTCVLCYVPAHEGCSPNEYADACAKSHLDGETLENVAEEIAQMVTSRARLQEQWDEKEGWVLMDRAMFRETRRSAGKYVRKRTGEGVSPGRTTAGATGSVWGGLARRAMRMAVPAVEIGEVQEKPTWEDVQAHNECVKVVMGLRSGDGVGVPHEREWERRWEREGEAGGEAARSGGWGCAACKRAQDEEDMAGQRRGERRMTRRAPRATMRHWLTEKCPAAMLTARAEVLKGAQAAVKAAGRVRGEGAEAVMEVCRAAERAAARAVRGEGVEDAEWEALAQLVAAQLPAVGKVKAATEAAMDAARRGMARAAAEQRNAAEAAGKKGDACRRTREEHRGWMKLVVRAWRAVVRDWRGRAAGWSGTGLELKTLAVEEVEARRRSRRAGRVEMRVVTKGRGTSALLIRCPTELWWDRLQQRIRAMATWAKEVRGSTQEWYVRGSGAREEDVYQEDVFAEEDEREEREEGEEERGAERASGRAGAVQESTREGIRLWWWMAGGEGGDASGPMSVRWGRRARTEDADPEETGTVHREAHVGVGVHGATDPMVVGELHQDAGDALDGGGVGDVLDEDDAGAAEADVVQRGGEKGEGGEEGGEGAGVVARGVGVARWSAEEDVGRRRVGGVAGVGEEAAGGEAERGEGGEEERAESRVRLGGADGMEDATREAEAERELAEAEAREGGADAERARREVGGEVQRVEDAGDGERMDTAAEGGGGQAGGEEAGGGEAAPMGGGGRDGECAAVLGGGEVTRRRRGEEEVMVGGAGECGGEGDAMEKRGGDGGGERREDWTAVEDQAAESALEAYDGGRRGGELPGGEVAGGAARRRGRTAPAEGGRWRGVKPRSEGGRAAVSDGGQREREEAAEFGTAAMEGDPQRVAMPQGSGRRTGDEGGAVVRDDGCGEVGGGAAAEGGEEGAPATEEGGGGEASCQLSCARASETNAAQSKKSDGSGGGRPTRRRTRAASGGGGSGGAVTRSAATRDVAAHAAREEERRRSSRKATDRMAKRPG